MAHEIPDAPTLGSPDVTPVYFQRTIERTEGLAHSRVDYNEARSRSREPPRESIDVGGTDSTKKRTKRDLLALNEPLNLTGTQGGEDVF